MQTRLLHYLAQFCPQLPTCLILNLTPDLL